MWKMNQPALTTWQNTSKFPTRTVSKPKSPAKHVLKDKLLTAIKANNLVAVKSLLAQSIDINKGDASGKTPLFYAVSANSAPIVEALITYGADVSGLSYVAFRRNSQFYSCMEPPLLTAARGGNLAATRVLVDAGADVNTQSHYGKSDDTVCSDLSALHVACEDCHVDLVELCLNADAKVNAQDRSGETPLHKVARCGRHCAEQCRITRQLCDRGADVDRVDLLQTSPLYLAAFYGCPTKVEILLNFGADIDQVCQRENSYGAPLHIAAARDNVRLADLLMERGARLDVRNMLGCTPLQLNINTMIKSAMAQRLLYHGASVTGRDLWGCTLLAACVRNMRIDCEQLCRLIVYCGCDLNQEAWLRPDEGPPTEGLSSENDKQGRQQEQDRSAVANGGDDTEPDSAIEPPPIPIPSGRVAELCEWLREKQGEPLALSELIRVQIRRYLFHLNDGRSIVTAIKKLPLPPALRDFVLLKQLVDLTVTPSNSKVFGRVL